MSKPQEYAWEEEMARQAKFVGALRLAGMPDRFYRQTIDDVGFREWLVEQVKEWLDETEMQKEARDIMGSNMLGILEVERHFVELTDEQREALEIIPFSEETLKAVAKTHILVADVGLSLLDVRKKVRKALFHAQDWYEGQEFAKRTETARWRLVRKHPVEGSFSKNWSEQERLIDSEVDEIPSARQVVYTMILHFLATGERLFEKVYVRTNDVDSDGNRVNVGSFDEDGLGVDGWYGSDRYSDFGVASARLPDRSSDLSLEAPKGAKLEGA